MDFVINGLNLICINMNLITLIEEVTEELNVMFGEGKWAFGGSLVLNASGLILRNINDIDICTEFDYYNDNPFESVDGSREYAEARISRGKSEATSTKFFDFNGDEVRCFGISLSNGMKCDVMYRKSLDISKLTNKVMYGDINFYSFPEGVKVQDLRQVIRYKEMVVNQHTSGGISPNYFEKHYHDFQGIKESLKNKYNINY